MLRWILLGNACIVISCLAAQQEANSDGPPDGLYHVVETFAKRPSELDNTVQYDYRMVDSSAQEARYIRIDLDNYIPLQLAQPPERVIQEDGRSNLHLTLTRKAKCRMRKLTGRWVGARVCLVIGGEAVTMHKVREKITGGQIQVTRCTDDACEQLFYELRDNVED